MDRLVGLVRKHSSSWHLCHEFWREKAGVEPASTRDPISQASGSGPSAEKNIDQISLIGQ
jgi:hypothetical protein